MSKNCIAKISGALCLILILQLARPLQAGLSEDDIFAVYLPLVQTTNPFYGRQSIHGFESLNIDRSELATQVGAQWLRNNERAFYWSDIEANEGERNWEIFSVISAENYLRNASANGINAIATVRSAPEWARKLEGGGPSCGPIAQNKLDAFARLMTDLVSRYSQPPYNVKYWEIWNEPDAPQHPLDFLFGCWGDPSDSYFGGGYYAEMLKQVSPAIKSADPDAKILIGGLLLDCNPDTSSECVSGKFLEGILDNGGAAYFDFVNVHGYDYWSDPDTIAHYSDPKWKSAWNTTGPTIGQKLSFVNALLKRYGAQNKELIVTETALLCFECVEIYPNLEQSKAVFLVESYALAAKNNVRAVIWYSVEGWHRSNLLGADDSYLPAMNALKTSSKWLKSAIYARDVPAELGVMGYEFNISNTQRVWFLRSRDDGESVVQLPSAPLEIESATGEVLDASSTRIAVNRQPIYVKMSRVP